MEKQNLEICPLCGHRSATIEGLPDGYGWNIIRCNNCFTCHIHESIVYQFSDKGNDIEINKRKRYNCIYQFLLSNPTLRGYYFKFFYEESEINNPTSNELYVNVAKLFDNMPKTTKEKVYHVVKGMLEKYGLNKKVNVADLDLGLMLHEVDGDKESLISYLHDNNLITATTIASGEVTSFKMNLNSKLYLEDGDMMDKQQINQTNVTNNYNDNSITVTAGKNINKTIIGSNETSANKQTQTQIQTNVETNIVKEKKGCWLSRLFKKK